MTAKELWDHYAATWSRPAAERPSELEACVVEDVAYCDPHNVVEGRAALCAYMGGFQTSVPGGRFEIESVIDHHGRMLAHWTLRGPDGASLQSGASFALAADDGRLRDISGFFPLAGAA